MYKPMLVMLGPQIGIKDLHQYENFRIQNITDITMVPTIRSQDKLVYNYYYKTLS